jgi:hypothetical protein
MQVRILILRLGGERLVLESSFALRGVSNRRIAPAHIAMKEGMAS